MSESDLDNGVQTKRRSGRNFLTTTVFGSAPVLSTSEFDKLFYSVL
jgi:hypothetical protein